tara:strand:+ start:983 stop:1519 length:537 start_codon:yes stop_codon:yes gene_type:complete
VNHLYTRKVNEAIEATKVYLEQVVEKPDPAFAGFAPCPFARRERIGNGIMWHAQRIKPLEADEETLQILTTFLQQNEKKSLILLDCFSKIGYKDIVVFGRHFKRFVKELGLSALVFHPDHPYSIGGVKTRCSPYPMINLGLDKDFNKGYNVLRKTDYYSKWSLSELSKISREKEFKDG